VLAQLAPAARLESRKAARTWIGAALAAFAAVYVVQRVVPALGSLDTADAARVAAADVEYLRVESASQPPMPSTVTCGQPLPPWPRGQAKGWNPGCTVDTVTNVYLGVPPRDDGTYELRFKTDGQPSPSLRVSVNGSYYTARAEPDGYAVTIHVDNKRLYTPVVMVAIEWTRQPAPLPLKLFEVGLGNG
jgi:hypothetical protein